MKRFVVGIDGSQGSIQALRWAVAQAEVEGAAVEVVHSWTVPYAAGSLGGMPFDLQMLADGARATLEETVASVDAGGLATPITTTLVEGPAARVLLDAAEGADLVVVGSRGHGGFMGLLLGSVSQQVASHAPCPVVIVPTKDS